MGAGCRVALVAAAVTLMAACGHQADADEDLTSPAGRAASAPTSTSTEPDPAIALVARADHDLDVHPGPGSAPTTTLPAATEFGSPRALLVVEDQGEWLEVALPARPNGSTGWIRRDDVELREVDEAIEIDLAARQLTLLNGGAVVLTTPVAIGTSAAPTPTGAFYVVDKLATGDPDGPYGPFALGLSAHSDVLTDFAGGDGQVGIHGTNEPASIGQAVSHGCIRVPNEVAEALNQLVQLGTPVTIG